MIDAGDAGRHEAGGGRAPTRYEAALAFAEALLGPDTPASTLRERLDPLVQAGPLLLRLLPDALIWRQRLVRPGPAATALLAGLHRDGARTLVLAPRAPVDDLALLLDLLHRPLATGERRALVVALYAPPTVRLLLVPRPHLTLERDEAGETVLVHPGAPAAARGRPRPPPPPPPPWLLAPPPPTDRDPADDPALAALLADVPAEAWPDAPPAGLVELVATRAELGGPAAVEALLRAIEEALPDPRHPLRLLLAGPAVLVALAEAFDADPERLAPALATLCRPAPDGLVALLRHVQDPGARAVAFRLADEIGCDLSAYYHDMLRRPDPVRAREAARGLEPMRGEAAVGILAVGLDHPDPAVRHDVLAALAGRWDPRLRRPVGRLLHDPEPENRRMALRLVRESGDRRMIGAVLAAVRADGFTALPPEDRRAFLDTLAESGDPRVLAWFEEFLSQPNLRRSAALADTREAAVAALAERGGAAGRDLLDRLAGRWTLPRRVRAAIQQVRGAR